MAAVLGTVNQYLLPPQRMPSVVDASTSRLMIIIFGSCTTASGLINPWGTRHRMPSTEKECVPNDCDRRGLELNFLA